MTRALTMIAVSLLCGVAAGARDRPLGERLAEAQSQLQAGVTRPVIEQLELLRAEFPEDPAVQALLGRALLLNREFAAAEPLLTEAIAGGHGDFGTRLTLAAVLWENGRLEQAETLYREAVESSDGDPAALYPLAKLLLWRGDARAAAELFGRVRDLRPDWVEVSLEYARALEQSERPVEALEQISAFVTAAPEHAEGLYTLATILRQLNRPDEAAAALERFLAAQAEDRESTVTLGRRQAELDEVRAHIARGEGAAALTRLDGVSRDVETLRLRARALEVEGRWADALRALEQAVATDPSRADVRVELQEAYRRSGDSQ